MHRRDDVEKDLAELIGNLIILISRYMDSPKKDKTSSLIKQINIAKELIDKIEIYIK